MLKDQKILELNKIYLDKQNRLVFPYKKIRNIIDEYSMLCYHTVYPVGDDRLSDIMKIEYLQMDGTNLYNDEESIKEELTTLSEIYIKNKDFIEKVKNFLDESLYNNSYLNAIIFPRSILDADIKFEATNW